MSYLKEIKLTQGMWAKVSDEDFEWLNQYKWHAHLSKRRGKRKWYARGWMSKTERIYMHRFIKKAKRHLVVDHIDGDGLNNQRENLRCCTVATNNRNLECHRAMKAEAAEEPWL